jgi:hypothetical protein
MLNPGDVVTIDFPGVNGVKRRLPSSSQPRTITAIVLT